LLALIYGWSTEGFDTEDLKEAKAYSPNWREPIKAADVVDSR
jgi:hypothetical protein